ncbi:MAG: hypothetical protein MZV63_16925 [Marinilabiliales bacterium]|nr:hypothetical protein [Marinilabiliales bacterium]
MFTTGSLYKVGLELDAEPDFLRQGHESAHHINLKKRIKQSSETKIKTADRRRNRNENLYFFFLH